MNRFPFQAIAQACTSIWHALGSISGRLEAFSQPPKQRADTAVGRVASLCERRIEKGADFDNQFALDVLKQVRNIDVTCADAGSKAQLVDCFKRLPNHFLLTLVKYVEGRLDIVSVFQPNTDGLHRFRPESFSGPELLKDATISAATGIGVNHEQFPRFSFLAARKYMDYLCSERFSYPEMIATDIFGYYQKKGLSWTENSIDLGKISNIICGAKGGAQGQGPLDAYNVWAHGMGGQQFAPRSEIVLKMAESIWADGIPLNDGYVHPFLSDPQKAVDDAGSFARGYLKSGDIRAEDVPSESELLDVWIDAIHHKRTLLAIQKKFDPSFPFCEQASSFQYWDGLDYRLPALQGIDR